MSRHHRKNLKRGIPSPLGSLVLPPRKSRHGRVMVGDAQPGMTDDRPSPFTKTWRTVETNSETGLVEVKHHKRLMTAEEVQEERNKVKRAITPTAKLGLKNEAPKKPGSVGQK
jgi:hypothetical protein